MKVGMAFLAIISVWNMCLADASGADSSPATFDMGVVPQQSPSKMLRTWEPILNYVRKRTGYTIVFRTAPDIPTFERRLANGEYQFAYMNPYHFTVFSRGLSGYRAIAKAKNKKIRGVLVVRKESPIQSLSDLQGSELAFPAPAAFAASVLPRAHLEKANVDFDALYVSSHDSVYKAVARGLYVAGGGVMRTFKTTDPSVREQLRVMWTTPGYTPHAIAAHSSVSSDVRLSVQEALLELSNEQVLQPVLESMGVKGFVAAVDSDWDDVRSLGLKTQLAE